MKKVVSKNDVFIQHQLKRPADSDYVRNFYNFSSLPKWIEHGLIYSVGDDENLLLLRQDRDFFHVYIVRGFLHKVLRLIDNLDNRETYVIDVIDVVDSAQSTNNLVQSLMKNGFQPHRFLKRMDRKPLQISISTDGAIRKAQMNDVSWIMNSLETHFDRFTEQLPYRFEIVEAIKKSQISVAEINGFQSGFLFSENTKLRTVLRYWYVNPEARSSGIGGLLMRDYLRASCSTRLSQLWVVAENADAIMRYDHYGYTFGSLANTVLVRNG